jgi:hypothetical protein
MGKSLMSRGSSSRPASMNPRHMKLVAEGLLLGVAENHCLRGISRNMLCEYFTSGSRFLSKVLKFFWCILWFGRSFENSYCATSQGQYYHSTVIFD